VINNQGHVVGHANSDTSTRAYLWTPETGMQNLGTLPGDLASFARGISDKGEVVGLSLDASFNPRAFFWRNGAITDLNTLIPANSGLYLLKAESVNSSGEIVGLGVISAAMCTAFWRHRAVVKTSAEALRLPHKA
jgi:probable HAF family extracellular repeat protein